MIDRPSFWIATLLLGAGTYAIRLSFLALSQNRQFSERMKRILSFVPVTVLPALIAPTIVFPLQAGGAVDPARIIAAAVALIAGLLTRSVIAVILAGIGTLMAIQALLG